MITVLQLCLIVWSCFFPITTLAKSDTPGGYNQSFDYDVLNRLSTAYQGQEGRIRGQTFYKENERKM